MKIFLIGYMGSGKTTVGKLLSNELNQQFFDIDQEIEKEHQMSIAEIFTTKGEVYFRKAERRMLEKLIDLSGNVIISLGGGTPCYGDNMQLIKDASSVKSIYLKLDIQSLLLRLKPEKAARPMISHLDNDDLLEEFIRKHLFERSFYYNQSDIVLDCSNKTPAAISHELIKFLG